MVSFRWVLTGLFLPIALHASEAVSSSGVMSSSSVTQAEEIAYKLTQAVNDGISYGLLFATIVAVAAMALGLVASMINRSVGG